MFTILQCKDFFFFSPLKMFHGVAQHSFVEAMDKQFSPCSGNLSLSFLMTGYNYFLLQVQPNIFPIFKIFPKFSLIGNFIRCSLTLGNKRISNKQAYIHLKELGKKNKEDKISRRKGIVKIRAQINETETKGNDQFSSVT